MEDQPVYRIQPSYPLGYIEKSQCYLPILHLLMQMGWHYLTPDETDQLRGQRLDNAIMEPLLVDYIRRQERYRFKGIAHAFTENAIQDAVQALRGLRPLGAIDQNQKAYELLCLGTRVGQAIDGEIKSFALHYIDWQHPEKNLYHCTAFYRLANLDQHTFYTADVVLFVNGIPLVVMACQLSACRRTWQPPLMRAIDQLVAGQTRQGAPHLYLYSQLLLALARNQACYGTTAMRPEFWSGWKADPIGSTLKRAINTALDKHKLAKLLTGPFAHIDPFVYPAIAQDRPVQAQDRLVFALCRPDSLLTLIYQYIFFHDGCKIIARYHQFFTVQQTLKRILGARHGQRRSGGVVCHAQGSGQSMTLVMLAKSLFLNPSIQNLKIILVTRQKELNLSINDAFRCCGVTVAQAVTGKRLVALLKNPRSQVVSIQSTKLFAATTYREIKRVDHNTFVLWDNACFSALNTFNTRFSGALKGACHIVFFGTPLPTAEKADVFNYFGRLIHPAYTMRQAVKEHVVVPVLYETRPMPRTLERRDVDQWMTSVISGLSNGLKSNIQTKLAASGEIQAQSLQKIFLVAWDVSIHYMAAFQGTGLKGQLVTCDIESALRYKQVLDAIGLVCAEVYLPAQTVKGPAVRPRQPAKVENDFRRQIIDRYGSEHHYRQQMINGFRHSTHPEIIIVVDDLLTFFHAPRNAVLYLARHLSAPVLLQAIGRINRLYSGKAYGMILYYGAFMDGTGHCSDFYDQLTGYDPVDLTGMVTAVRECTDNLSRYQADLWALFTAIAPDRNLTHYAAHLREDNLRNKFYDHFKSFARTLRLALASSSFLIRTSLKSIKHFKRDLLFFQKLRLTLSERYQEYVSTPGLEQDIQKCLQVHTGSGTIEKPRAFLNLLDKDQREKLLTDKHKSADTKTDIMASATRHLLERYRDSKPDFYHKFSMRLTALLKDYHTGRLPVLKALSEINNLALKVATPTDDDIPAELADQDMARRFYSQICEPLPDYGPVQRESATRIAMAIAGRLAPYRDRDWLVDPDVINQMRGEIDDLLFDAAEALGLELSLSDLDTIIDRCISVTLSNGF